MVTLGVTSLIPCVLLALSAAAMSTHTVNFTSFEGQAAVAKRFEGDSWEDAPFLHNRPLNRKEAYVLERSILARLGATTDEGERDFLNGTCGRHFPKLLDADDDTLTLITTNDGHPLNSREGLRLFCALKIGEVSRQERCITLALFGANVAHLDHAPIDNGKNVLISDAGRLTLFDFDVAAIDGWLGNGTKPSAANDRFRRERDEHHISDLHRSWCSGFGARCYTARQARRYARFCDEWTVVCHKIADSYEHFIAACRARGGVPGCRCSNQTVAT